MSLVPKEISELAQKVYPDTTVTSITLLEGGYSSQAYKVDTNEKTFVLLVARKGAVSSQNYGHAYVVLTLLKQHSYKYSPDPLWLADDQSALAISHYGGVASDEFDFASVDSKKLAIEVIDALLGVATISLEEYKQLAKQYGVTEDPVESSKDSARMYGTEWLEIVQRSCPDQDIIDWLTPRVERSVAMSNEATEHAPVFGHGDPSNPNILIKPNGEFMLIDWGSARFHMSGPEFLVAYTTHLTDFMGPYRDVLIEHIAQKLDISLDDFTERVTNYRMRSEVLDVNWAAMMMAKIHAGDTTGDIAHFRGIARERIRLYEQDFGTSI